MNSTRAVTYRRVSTEDQADSGLGLTAQKASIDRHLELRGWTRVGEFVDEGVSGKVAPSERASLADALTMLDAGHADVLVVAKLDRLTRSVGDLSTLLARADRARWSIVILDADVDTTTAGGRLVANVLGSVAEWERMVISERTKAALAARRKQGKRNGRRVELDAEIRDRIVAARQAGATLQAVADMLNAEGVPTARVGKWHASTVKHVVESVALDAELAAMAEGRQ